MIHRILESREFPYVTANGYYFKRDGLHIVVDTGSALAVHLLKKGLETHGISADDIDIVINTHMHIDHCANNHLFKNARYIVPAEEIGYLKTLFSSSKEEAECFFRMLYPSLNERFIKTYVKLLFASKNAVDWMFFHPNVQRVSGDMFLTNHIQLITTYGHCPGHICVVVENDENEFHCISGDILIDPQDDVNQDGVQHIVSDKQALMESKKKLKSMVSYVFPGHGNSFNASVAI